MRKQRGVKTTSRNTENFALILICFGLAMAVIGCAEGIVRSTYKPEGDFIQCNTDVKIYKKDNVEVNVEVVKPKIIGNTKCYSVQKNFKAGQGSFLYCDKGSIVSYLEHPLLRGSHFIQTRYEDRNLTIADHLTIRFDADIEGIYVAYDARATKKPEWLTNKFYPEINKATGKPYTLSTTLDDKSPGATGSVRLPRLSSAVQVTSVFPGGNIDPRGASLLIVTLSEHASLLAACPILT